MPSRCFFTLLERRSRIFHYAIKEPRARQDSHLVEASGTVIQISGHYSIQDAERLRRSRRSQGLPPEFGLYEKAKRTATSKMDMTSEKQDAQTILITPTILVELRKPTIFRGEPGQDPIKWLNKPNGTARKWYENNEDSFTSWTLLENGLKAAFGDTQTHVRRARDRLKSRAQKPGECIQSYMQDVLELCKQAEPNMSEEDKVSHLMKGVAEDLFQALLARDVQTSGDFTRWCLHIEEM
ncbi:CCHC-type domain-containing protein [Trichonephila inaurata madagascariensis]|uniref:CCHC-type domain-containing protein n=1 Tax=Trichonephila inaurata madagascariensis TaxID=2747483 RepID=A0A8X6IT04_9ARAC|nr:CCHC-type domain-containing protein [Trichonephila inaurata madagascariensis]